MSASQDDPALASVSCLSDPVRGQLYEFVARRQEPVGRDEAAAAVGIGRAIAVYHLDKLVESGLLTASYRRPLGRGGPGAGRPAKFYARSGREFTVTVPPREYELAAHLLAQAVAADRGGASQAALRDAACRFGAEAGAAHRAAAAAADRPGAGVAHRAAPVVADAPRPDATHRPPAAADEPRPGAGDRAAAAGDGPGAGDRAAAAGDGPGPGGGYRVAGADEGGAGDAARVGGALRAHGFEPWPGADGGVVLRNCPFHRLAARHREIVCGMNLALIEGLMAGLGAHGMHPELDPRPGQCCVVIRASGPPARASRTGTR